MGENDTPYNRNKVAKKGKETERPRNNDPEGYPHLVTIHKGKGHWMELLDTVAIFWMDNYKKTYP